MSSHPKSVAWPTVRYQSFRRVVFPRCNFPHCVVYPPGLFMIPLLIGPIIGPLLGGGLAQAFGWRSTFICLTVFAGQ